MDLGIKIIRRETFLSSLDLTRELLRGLGYSERDVSFAIDTFRAHDERRLMEDYEHRQDFDKLWARPRSYARELEDVFKKDAIERATPVPRDRAEAVRACACHHCNPREAERARPLLSRGACREPAPFPFVVAHNDRHTRPDTDHAT